MPKTSQDLFDALDGLSIPYTNHEHTPVFTVGESEALHEQISGGHTKNLFLKDKKGRYFLLTVGAEDEIDLKGVHHLIGAQGRVSFGKPEPLMEYLGVIPGAVTCLGIINDPDQVVTLIFDAALWQHDVINSHPLRNDATTSIARDDLARFVEAMGRPLRVEALSRQAQEA